MIDLNDRRTADVVVEVAEAVAARQVARLAPVTAYGVVFGAPDTARRHVAVKLKGSDEPSAGFVYGSVVPVDGDFVRVIIAPRGDRYVVDVLGRDFTLPTLTALPAATVELRGRAVLLLGGTGVADQVYVCRKKADETYEWAAAL